MGQGNDQRHGHRHAGKRFLLRPLMLASELGTTMGLVTAGLAVAGLLFGIWVDQTLGTRPLATIGCLVLGALAGLLGMIDLAQSTARQLNRAAARHQRLRTAFSLHDLGRALRLVLWVILATTGPPLVGLVLGMWLDGLLGCKPLFAILLPALGALSALLLAAVLAGRANRRPFVGR